MSSLVARDRPRRRGYSDVPHALWTLPTLAAAPRLILGWLHSHDAGYLGTITVNRIRREFGTSSVSKYLSEIEEAGFIAVDRHQNGHAAKIVLLMDPWEDLFDLPARSRLGTSPESARYQPDLGAPVSARVEDHSEKNSSGDQKEPSSASPTERFDRFWSRYPRAVGKPAARKAFKSAVKRSGLEAIQQGYRAWEAFWRDGKVPEQFIPHPATWLNQERYNDAPPAITTLDVTLDVAKRLFEKYEAEEAGA